ncbi:MAG TPA: hypothetical protein VN794_01645 [Methylomirabilota bacterium]|jgi:hypothetical protein|nr:hypothetical protein [Methylomirabilota bacterium]
MKPILYKLIGRLADLVDVQPVIALFLGGALLAVFLTVLFRARPQPEPGASLVWTLYRHLTRLLWASLMVSALLASLALMRVYLHQTLAGFQRTHGRVTQANYNAVQTIWGAEQEQGELHMANFWEEEVTERIESEDLTKPAVLRKKTVRHDITANPFVSTRHDVTLTQNPRKKGSALYGGYETACRFFWRLKNPASRDLKSMLKFPLPASGSMYDDLTATLNGQDVLPQMQLKDSALILARDLAPNETLDLAITFKSRGMSLWYLQVKEAREIRDFTLTLNLPDLPRSRLNYPEGCMTPTSIRPTPDNQGSLLTYRLDHAISNKGMGIALPTLPQPGEVTNAVLAEVERGWLLVFAMLTLGLTLAGARHAVLLSIGFGAASACVYGLVGDFSDLFSGPGGAELLVLLPLFVALAWCLTRIVPLAGKVLALQFLLFGLLYPAVAGLDNDRQTLYFNLSALGFLCFGAWQIFQRLHSGPGEPEAQAPRPAPATG